MTTPSSREMEAVVEHVMASLAATNQGRTSNFLISASPVYGDREVVRRIARSVLHILNHARTRSELDRNLQCIHTVTDFSNACRDIFHISHGEIGPALLIVLALTVLVKKHRRFQVNNSIVDIVRHHCSNWLLQHGWESLAPRLDLTPLYYLFGFVAVSVLSTCVVFYLWRVRRISSR